MWASKQIHGANSHVGSNGFAQHTDTNTSGEGLVDQLMEYCHYTPIPAFLTVLPKSHTGKKGFIPNKQSFQDQGHQLSVYLDS